MAKRSTTRLLGALLLAGTWTAPLPAQQAEIDLALVLAIDCSYSVDAKEFRLQMQGLGQALMSPEVIEAIAAGPNGRIAVTVYLWSNDQSQRVILPWTTIEGAVTAKAVGTELAQARRAIAEGGTGISAALIFGAGLFEIAPPATRKVIDLSTDGRNNMGPPTSQARNTVVARGITINGLAIANEWPMLDKYMEGQVAGGQGNFVIKTLDYEGFEAAMQKKLVREITGPGVT